VFFPSYEDRSTTRMGYAVYHWVHAYTHCTSRKRPAATRAMGFTSLPADRQHRDGVPLSWRLNLAASRIALDNLD
jgi:hypothetical protein